MESIACLVNGAHGIYAPQAFIDLYDAAAWGITPADAEILRAGPDADWYWEAWDHVLGTAYYLADDGRRFTLWQDGDLFAIAYDALTDDEYREFFGEDRH